jgi:hypothetical protein
MLIPHGSFHILVSHGFHYSREIARAFQHAGAEVVSPAIQDQVFGKPRLGARQPKLICHVG